MRISGILKMLFVSCAFLCLVTSCTQDEGDQLPRTAFVVSPAEGVTFAYESFEKQIQITSNANWTVAAGNDANWLTITEDGGLITLKALPNETAEERVANLVFSVPGLDHPVMYPVRSLPLNRPKDEISIITYNVKDGFAGLESTTPNNGPTLNRFRAFAKAQNPDIICYQELKGYTADLLKTLAESLEIGHQYVEFFQVSSGHNLGISSRYPISNTLKVQTGLTHGLLIATCRNVGFGITQLNEENTEDKRVQESNTIVENLKSYSTSRVLDGTMVCGDLHALSSYDKSVYGADKNYQTLTNFNDKGYKGIYDLLKTPVGENTTNYTGGNYRYDHMLVSQGLWNSCVSYGVVKNAPVPDISDHFPVKTIVKVTQIK